MQESFTLGNFRLAVVFVIFFVLAGCQTNPPKPVTDDQKRTQAEATLLGAVMGGLIGVLSTGDVKGALIGSIAGGLGGYVTGVQLSQLKQKRIAREASLDEHVRHVEEVTMLARQYNDQLGREIAQLELETEQVRTQYQKTRGNQAELAAKQTEVRHRKAKAEQAYADLNDEYLETLEVLKDKKRAGVNSKGLAVLRGKVDELKLAISELRTQNRQLATIERRIP